MLLDLYFHHQNSAPRSGVSRLWLIEYYTKELEKREALKVVKKPPAPITVKRRAAKRAVAVENLATKDEADLEALTQGISDAAAAQRFISILIAQVQVRAEPEFDFMKVAEDFKKRRQRRG